MRAQQQQVRLRFRTLAKQDRVFDMNHGRIGDRTRQQTGENAYGSRMKTANRRHLESLSVNQFQPRIRGINLVSPKR